MANNQHVDETLTGIHERDLSTVSNTSNALNRAANSRPSISEAAEELVALTTPADLMTEDTVAEGALIEFNLEEDSPTAMGRKGVRRVDNIDDDLLRKINTWLDHTRKDGRTNYNAYREDGKLYLTERVLPNLCDADVWKLVRKHLAFELLGRGMVKYDPSAAYSVRVGSFQIYGSRSESTRDGKPTSYPRMIVLSICEFADSVARAKIHASSNLSLAEISENLKRTS